VSGRRASAASGASARRSRGAQRGGAVTRARDGWALGATAAAALAASGSAAGSSRAWAIASSAVSGVMGEEDGEASRGGILRTGRKSQSGG